jgi:hypothetical protein
MDDGCLKVFFDALSESYPDHHLLSSYSTARPATAPSRSSTKENVSVLMLPAYSPELDPALRDGSKSSGEGSRTGCSRA